MRSGAGTLHLALLLGAGLATGLSRFPDPVVWLLALGAGALLRGDLRRRACCAAAAVGVLLGAGAAHRARGSCAQRLPVESAELTLRSVDPGPGSGRVAALGAGCHGVVQARWPRRDTVAAGTVARVTARWEARRGPLGRADGTLVVGRVHSISGRPGLVARSRSAMRDAIVARFGSHAPLVVALVMGQRGGLDGELRRDFAAAGLVHLLVISGFHVGLLAGWVALGVGVIGLPRRWGARAGALAALGYAAWLGWPAPATRAAVLMAVLLIGRWRQRQWRPDGTIGSSAIVVMLLDPWAITRIGAWLSFVALGGVLLATRWTRMAWPRRHPIIDLLSASLGATVATAPLAAAFFGQVALVGVVLNLVAMPLTALAVPAIGLALAAHRAVPAMASAYAAAADWLLDRLVALGQWGSDLPGAGVAGPDGLMAALPWLGLLLVCVVAIRGRATPREALRRLGWGGAVLAWAALLAPLRLGAARPAAGELQVTFLDVGQGDAAVIRTPGGRWIVVDAGPADARWDAGARVVVPFLRRAGARRVDLLVLSHAHRDHVGGAEAVLDAFPVGALLEPGEPFEEAAYRRVLERATQRRVRWHVGVTGARWTIDGVTFRIVHPGRRWTGRGIDLNDDSVVLEVRWGEFVALFAGDAGERAVPSYLTALGPVDLLKVGHHGSRTATGEALLARIRPEAAVVSLGRNRYGHPAPETMARLAAARTRVWRTDREGPVTMTTDGRTFTVRGERTHATFDAADP